MNTRIFTAILLSAFTASAMAQETYENATIGDNDLNGTARYVGMGGAMEGLGTDISTIGTNPAGIGTFRSSQAAVTGGVQITNGDTKLVSADKTKASFDQVGVVLAMKGGYSSFVNLAFNYHKSKNFNQILNASHSLGGIASQNKLSYIKGYYDMFTSDDQNYSQLDAAYYDHFITRKDGIYYYEDANSYDFSRVSKGYIGNYDFNISGNINNQVYLGVTFGIKDVHYDGTSYYTENLVDEGDELAIKDRREITGQGFDVKIGAIVRPFQYSGFRIGAYIHTPTFYKLTTVNKTQISSVVSKYSQAGAYSESYQFELRTPWTFGLSAGHTIGNNLALGLTYEYADYNYLQSRVYEGQGYEYSSTYADDEMDEWTKKCLKGVHTLKIGAEYRPISMLALRCGYNFVSPKYDGSKGYKNGALESWGSYYASQTDYTNWKATNRFTFGVGITAGKFFADLAYQYSQRNGEFCPFMSYYSAKDSSLDNICDKVSVSEKRHNLLLTLGFKF